ncbi:AraC family transcriptional regulator [Phenylobacterium sp.]|uniref:helix-turn-helix transcriptional regulator n=1 Tax=Phenylobacterium sp. TaxID=1871053 RepID=UPI002736A1FB|nr:AraC family transcriptional regulator [Phenylobacterium sp.]MDP3853039.1 AraC family transcriptional regulator ligand-binding domain-containing protein [Phenylobacterium sp.]
MHPPRTPIDWQSPGIHPTQARLVLILLERAGVPVDDVLAEVGVCVADLESAVGLVPFGVLRRLILALPPQSREGFGLELGELAPSTVHGPLGVAMAASATLDEALRSLADFGGPRLSAGRFRYRLARDFGDMEFIESFEYEDMRLIVLESTAMQVGKMITAVVGRTPEGTVFQFPYPPPPWADRYGACFPGAIEYGATALRIRTPRAALAARCLAADAKARAAALRECQQEVWEVDFGSSGDIASLIRSRLAEAGDAYPTLEAVAASLAVSPRTLIRRLKVEGLRYQGLVDEARTAVACWRLANTAGPVEQIAADLGFHDTSNFSRTFRRWRGMTPSQYRSSLRSSQAPPA